MNAHDLRALLGDLPCLEVTRDTSDEAAMAAIRPLGMLNQTMLGLVRFSGLTPWEIHPDGDELLHVLEGSVEVTVLTDDGPYRETLRTGSVFVVPRGLWHRQHAHPHAGLLFATAAGTTASSWADDPRAEGAGAPSPR